MRTFMRDWLVVAALTVATAASAETNGLDVAHCQFPDAPTVPDGSVATEEEMGQAGTQVREYVAGVQTSLKCLAEVEESMGKEISKDQQNELVSIYNTGVDQMNAVAQDYNEQVQVYKKR